MKNKLFITLLIIICIFTLLGFSNINPEKIPVKIQNEKQIETLKKQLGEKNKEIKKLKNDNYIYSNLCIYEYPYKTRFIGINTHMYVSPYKNIRVQNDIYAGTVVKVICAAEVYNNNGKKDKWLFINIPVFDTPLNNYGWIKESFTEKYTKDKMKYVLREVTTKAGNRGQITKREGNKVLVDYSGGDSDWLNINEIIYPKPE